MKSFIIVCSIALIVLCIVDLVAQSRSRKKMANRAAEKAERTGISLEVATREEYEDRMKQLEDSECCGTHEVCEKQQMIRALREKIEYFNDEELDAYRGIGENDYTDEQIDEFRDVLYTMQTNEIEDWLKSLDLRGVTLPLVLKEEVCQLIAQGRIDRMNG